MVIKDNSNTLTLSQDDWRKIEEHSKTLDILDPQISLEYALTLQKKIAALPNKLMNQLKNDLATQANELIPILLAEIASFTPDEDILKNPVKNKKALKKLRTDYDKISQKITKLLSILQEQKLVLMQNSSILKRVESNTIKLYRSLVMHIESGKLCIERVEKKLEALAKISYTSDTDYATREILEISLRSFKERISSLEITKNILTTLLVQIRTYTVTNDISFKKVHETYHKTIPSWRKKITIALRVSDVVDVISEANGNESIIDIETENKSLVENISDLKSSFVSNQTSKAALDEVYLLSKALEKELNNS